MEVAATRFIEAIFAAKGLELCPIFVRVAWIVDLESVKAEALQALHKHIESAVQQVFFWMSNRRESAEFFDELDRLDWAETLCLAIRLSARAKPFVKSLLRSLLAPSRAPYSCARRPARENRCQD